MCYMAVYPPGVIPKMEHLDAGAKLNPHGVGWSIGLNEVYHSLPPYLCVPMFIDARLGATDGTAIFHARSATGGTPVTLANCQPLVLGDGTILAHNGALFPVDGTESDTRVFAEQILPRWDLDDLDQRQELRELIYPNKFVILRPGKPPVMLNDRLGFWLGDGSWHSNTDYADLDHQRPGVCCACGAALPPDEDTGKRSQQCWSCWNGYQMRRVKLEAAR